MTAMIPNPERTSAMSNLFVSFGFTNQGLGGFGYVILRNFAAPTSGEDVIAMIAAVESTRTDNASVVPMSWQELPDGDGSETQAQP